MKSGKISWLAGLELVDVMKAEERAPTAPSVPKEKKLKSPNVTPLKSTKKAPALFSPVLKSGKKSGSTGAELVDVTKVEGRAPTAPSVTKGKSQNHQM